MSVKRPCCTFNHFRIYMILKATKIPTPPRAKYIHLQKHSCNCYKQRRAFVVLFAQLFVCVCDKSKWNHKNWDETTSKFCGCEINSSEEWTLKNKYKKKIYTFCCCCWFSHSGVIVFIVAVVDCKQMLNCRMQMTLTCVLFFSFCFLCFFFFFVLNVWAADFEVFLRFLG